MTRKCLLLLTVMLSHAAYGLSVEQAYVRGLPPTQKNTAAFFVLENDGETALTLRAGSSSAAERLEIHSHRQHNGMSAMRREDSVTLLAGERLAFAPGGYHLMLINLRAPLRDGEQLSFTLLDSQGEEYRVQASVRSVLKEAPSNGHHHGHGEHH